ncbi:uncharacterized protein LOC106669833 [Cimex lectularius]|uniref:Uncharacterized protein n=1 Tax=Cimex lectularius TaxID=79782 RepID=A0A8I6S3G5_CIMLE|nr:uncharacterized protein LOC106669833 [Cimex lectularius]
MDNELELDEEMDEIFFPRQPHKKRRKIIRVHNVSNEEEDSEKQNNSSEIVNETLFTKYITDYKGQKLLVHWLQSDQEIQNCDQQPSQESDDKTPENSESKEPNGIVEIDTSQEEETKRITELESTLPTEVLCENVCDINGKEGSEVDSTDKSAEIPCTDSNGKDVQKEIEYNLLGEKENSLSISEDQNISGENDNNVENLEEETISSQLESAPIAE